MANPQLEDGYTRIANEILDALIALRLPGQEWQIVLAIIRKTYGYGKKEDVISFRQLSAMTGIPRRKVISLFKSLVSKRALGSAQNGTRAPRTIWFNKDFSQWQPSAKKDTGAQIGTIPSAQIGPKSSAQIGTHKRKKEKEKKESVPLPEFIPSQLWAEFKAMRVKIRKPMTAKAEVLAIAKLTQFKNRGFNVAEILESSIFNSWQGLFEPKITVSEQAATGDHRTVCRVCRKEKSFLLSGVCKDCEGKS